MAHGEYIQDALIFDPLTEELLDAHAAGQATRAASTIKQLSGVAMDFARVYRVPRYDEASRESDAEHSFMLALVAPELAVQFNLDLDVGLLTQFAIVHDLVELIGGDIPTFAISDTALAQKHTDEAADMQELQRRLTPYTYAMAERYEAQLEPEARFVKFIDKHLPVAVDLLGPGKKVMAEDYGVHDQAALDLAEARLSTRFARMFPEAELRFWHLVRTCLATELSEQYDEERVVA